MTIELTDVLQIGDPVAHRGAVVTPLFPRATPRAEYVTLDEAIPAGLRVVEVDAEGSVGEVAVQNPTRMVVMLYDGEELLGARQNRVLNVTVLVPAGGELPIPVSCVEQGRWRYESDAFSDSAHMSYPELRRRKAEVLADAPLERGRAQGSVWAGIAEKSARLGQRSPTGAHADMHRALAPRLGELAAVFPLQAGQCGAVLALDGHVACLDAVSRPDAFARLYPKLLRGYMLDAMETLDRPATGRDVVASFVTAVAAVAATRRPSVGLGEDLRLAGPAAVGSGLVLGDELIQISAYPPSDGGPAGPASRLRRPSQRRRAL